MESRGYMVFRKEENENLGVRPMRDYKSSDLGIQEGWIQASKKKCDLRCEIKPALCLTSHIGYSPSHNGALQLVFPMLRARSAQSPLLPSESPVPLVP